MRGLLWKHAGDFLLVAEVWRGWQLLAGAEVVWYHAGVFLLVAEEWRVRQLRACDGVVVCLKLGALLLVLDAVDADYLMFQDLPAGSTGGIESRW